MHHIYRDASKVLIWVGEEEESDAEAFDLLEKFGRITGSQKEHTIQTREIDDPDYRELLILNPDIGARWRPVSALLERPWFTRAWVVQEVATASQPYIVCGKHINGFEALPRPVDCLRSNGLTVYLGPLQHALLVMAGISLYYAK
jgi:hypothetical protein